MSLDIQAFFFCLWVCFFFGTYRKLINWVSEQGKQHPTILFKTPANTTECPRIKAQNMPTFSHLLYLCLLTARPIKKRDLYYIYFSSAFKFMLLERAQAFGILQNKSTFQQIFRKNDKVSPLYPSVHILFLLLF